MTDKLEYQVSLETLQDMCVAKGLKIDFATDVDRDNLIARLKKAEKPSTPPAPDEG